MNKAVMAERLRGCFLQQHDRLTRLVISLARKRTLAEG